MSEEGGRVQWEFSCLQGEVRGILQGDGDCSKSVTVETVSTTQLAILALAPQKRIALFAPEVVPETKEMVLRTFS